MKGDRQLKKKLEEYHKTRNRAKNIITRSGLKLTVMQEAFCRALADINSPTFNDVVASYESVANIKKPGDWVKVAAYRLKGKPDIQQRMAEILEETQFNDFNADVEHAKLIRQDKDFSTKLGAIKEYNRLKGRGKDSGAVINVQITNYADQNDQLASQLPAEEVAIDGVVIDSEE